MLRCANRILIEALAGENHALEGTGRDQTGHVQRGLEPGDGYSRSFTCRQPDEAAVVPLRSSFLS